MELLTSALLSGKLTCNHASKPAYHPLVFKILRIMKLMFICLFAFLMQVSAKTAGQNVTISAENVSLEKILQSIEKQTGFTYIAKKNLLKTAGRVSVNFKNIPVAEALNTCFKDQPFRYSINGKIIVIEEAVVSKRSAAPRPLLDENPPITVKGRIVNENGEPVVASVVIKGTNRGTTSDINGEFILENVEGGEELIITSASTESTTIGINKRTSLNISVKSAVNDLDAVVINKGYYSESKRLSTGSVAKIEGKDIQKQPVTNPLQALIGRMPGVYINQRNGFAGGQIDIQIRGQNSLRTSVSDNGNAPFYIVDGVPFTSTPLASPVNFGPIPDANPLNSINPSDIESIEVLKDADATAVYGSRGANGVVLITTKKGKAGKTKLDVNLSAGAAKVNQMLDVLDTKQYIEMRKEGMQNDGFNPPPAYAPYVRDMLIWDSTRNTDWQKELIGGTAHTTNAQVSISGGNAGTQFLFGGNYYKETTVFPADFNFKKGAGHFNLTHETPDKKFRASLSANYSANNNDLPFEDFTFKAITMAPNAPAIYNEDGTLNWNGWSNRFASLKNKYVAQTDALITNANLSYELAPGLTVKSSFGYTIMRNDELQTSTLAAQNPSFTDNIASAYFANSTIRTWIIEPQVNYHKKIGRGNLNVLLGTTIQENTREGKTLYASGFVNDAMIENIDAASGITIQSADYSQYRYNALFGRVNYIWDGNYSINLTGRRDGSSKFGPDKQFANFGAVGAAWIFSNEAIIKNKLSFLSFGKLRTSYGITGSDQIPDYGYLDSYTTTTYPYENGTGLVPTQLGNADYSWETNKKLEAALDLGLINDRILFSTSWYRNRSSNQLVGYSLSTVTGFSDVRYNLPAVVQNTGWEFELSTVNINERHLKWKTSLNLTIPRNKLVAYPGIENSFYANTKEVGKPLGIIKTYHYTGVDPQTGLYTFEDVDGDGQITYPNDLKTMVTVGQKFYGGFQNSLQYKGFQLDVFFQFVKQTGPNYLGSTFSAPGYWNYGTYSGNQPAVVMERWQKQGDQTNIQKFTGTLFNSEAKTAYNIIGDMAYGDASFIRLKNVSLSWQLPVTWVRKAKLQESKIYLQGQNLFTITNYLGDPEILAVNSLPTLRTIIAGIQLTF